MATEPIEVRMARLEGSYEQIDRRLGSIDDRLGRLETKVDAVADRLDRKLDTLSGRIYTLLYGVIAAVLVPIVIRVFFP